MEPETNFISGLSKWDNSLNSHYLEKARKEILECNGGVPPRVLDPFGGSGANSTRSASTGV